MYPEYVTALVETPHGLARLAVSEYGVAECAWPLTQDDELGGDLPGPPQNALPGGSDYMLLQAAAALLAYFSGDFTPVAKIPVDSRKLTPWQRKVYLVVRAIPPGEVRSYGQVAAACGNPRAARAVGRAMAANPVPLFVPCHRVVHGDGRAGNYSCGGPVLKEWLLARERDKTAM